MTNGGTPGVTQRIGDLAEDAADVVLTGGDDGKAAEALSDEARVVAAPQREATKRRSGAVVTASPLLSMPRAKEPEAIALFVHGGDETGYLRMVRTDPAYMRIVPFARDVERRSHGKVGGACLRLAVRGWNDPDKPAVEDTRWALGELRRRYPGKPIAVVGHSMGGRVVLDIAGSDDVAALVVLAPWASDEYDAERFLGTPLLAIHGTRDQVTEPEATQDLVHRIDEAGGDAEFVSIPGGHTMLWRAREWHRLCSRYLIERLLG